MDSDYKKYSLKRLDEWIHDAMSSSGASPQEIYDVIVGVVKENYYTYKHQTSQAYELLALLNGNGKGHLTCDKDDPSPECKKSWTSFWEDDTPSCEGSDLEALSNFYPHPDQPVYTEEELNAMCDKAASDEEKNKCREYNLREAEYYDKRVKLDATYDEMVAAGYTMTDDGFWLPPQKEDKVKRWVLPTQLDGLTGDVIVNLPDDLLEAANLKEGDTINWVDNGDGSYTMTKVTQPCEMDA